MKIGIIDLCKQIEDPRMNHFTYFVQLRIAKVNRETR